jgi:organic radical activating enzyme
MTNLIESIRQRFSPIHHLAPGMYAYLSPPEDPRNYRLHLRIDPGGDGILIVNASTVLHLNQTAAEYAYYLIHNLPVEKASRKMAGRYHLTEDQARNDYQDFIQKVMGVVELPDLDPEMYLGINRQSTFTGNISAPYRLDCALTYRLPADQPSDFAPTERVKNELSTKEWKAILDKAWQAGIPHIVFTGGEPTLRPDLPELLAQVEKNSQVSGLITGGTGLDDQDYFDTLLRTGLDHLTLVLQPEQGIPWDVIDRVLAADLYTSVHLTLTTRNQDQYSGILEQLSNRGVYAVSLSTSDPTLAELLELSRKRVADLGMELVWNLPVPYSASNPVALERDHLDKPEGAGRAWLYVEPDGDVLPDQGILQPMGNLLSDSWEQIWRLHFRVPPG